VTSAIQQTRDPLWRPTVIVFVSNFCLMLIEMAISRAVAPIVGVSLYTWTSIIGVLLAGISIGNLLGGKLADRHHSRRLLGTVFVLAGMATISILILVDVIGQRGLPQIAGVPLIVRMLLFFAALFFAPSVILGMISPIVIQLTVRDLNHSGNTVGNIYAAGTVGGILGTALTGFYLISMFGTRTILLGAAALLIGVGVLVGAWTQRQALLPFAALAAMALVFIAPLDQYMKNYCLVESNYFCIRVREQSLDNKRYSVLSLDQLVHSYNSLDDPSELRYPYEQIGAEMIEYMVRRDGSTSFLLLGGGGYTLPRYLDARYPDNVISTDVVEIDPEVTRVAYQYMGLNPDSRVRTINEDARQFLAFRSANEAKYDIVQVDVFNDFSVPYHLTTKEFAALVRAHLSDNGAYLLNMIDGGDTIFAKALIRSVGEVFPYLYFVPTNRSYDGIRLNTMLLIASPQPLDEALLHNVKGNDDFRHIDAWLISRSSLDTWLAKGDQIVLTDDFVPTDQLLAPTFDIKLTAR
jgi:spermidine synthase